MMNSGHSRVNSDESTPLGRIYREHTLQCAFTVVGQRITKKELRQQSLLQCAFTVVGQPSGLSRTSQRLVLLFSCFRLKSALPVGHSQCRCSHRLGAHTLRCASPSPFPREGGKLLPTELGAPVTGSARFSGRFLPAKAGAPRDNAPGSPQYPV